jgi:cytosine/adenosine deaminase-related metal-dependent hydrolase
MDANYTVYAHGNVYIDGGRIVAVQDASAPPPEGFAAVAVVPCGGTMFPGLIELHNHLSYDALPIWQVPQKYSNRNTWGGTSTYRALISGPMQVLGRSDAMPALIRYVEVKCLLGGVTTSQGIELYSNHGARRFYRGLIRNVEQTDDASLPEAATKISDVEARSAAAFRARLNGPRQLILHLAEGTNPAARAHFLALHLPGGDWAITKRLVGIHCVALTAADFGTLASHGGSMVWSPLSNLLLYGATAKITEALAAGVRIGLGSDWSPSGSKNLLGELKAARAVAPALLSDRELIAMATSNAAEILGWQQEIGSLEATKRADLIVVGGAIADPYQQLLHARESDLRLVMIEGVPRCGLPSLMHRLGVGNGESIRVAGAQRLLHVADTLADPLVAALTLATAKATLRAAMRDLRKLAAQQEADAIRPRAVEADAAAAPRWFLALDELANTGVEMRPRLGNDAAAGPRVVSPLAAAPKLSSVLQPIELDPLTVADDANYLTGLRAQKNLPAGLAQNIETMY